MLNIVRQVKYPIIWTNIHLIVINCLKPFVKAFLDSAERKIQLTVRWETIFKISFNYSFSVIAFNLLYPESTFLKYCMPWYWKRLLSLMPGSVPGRRLLRRNKSTSWPNSRLKWLILIYFWTSSLFIHFSIEFYLPMFKSLELSSSKHFRTSWASSLFSAIAACLRVLRTWSIGELKLMAI